MRLLLSKNSCCKLNISTVPAIITGLTKLLMAVCLAFMGATQLVSVAFAEPICSPSGTTAYTSSDAGWDCGHIPYSTDQIYVPFGKTAVIDSPITVYSVNSQGTLQIDNALYINGSLTHYGSTTGGGVVYPGQTANTISIYSTQDGLTVGLPSSSSILQINISGKIKHLTFNSLYSGSVAIGLSGEVSGSVIESANQRNVSITSSATIAGYVTNYGTFNNTGSVNDTSSGLSNNNGGTIFMNAGTVKKMVNDGLSVVNIQGGTINDLSNSGVVNVNSTTLNVTHSVSNGGTINLNSNQVVINSISDFTWSSPTLTNFSGGINFNPSNANYKFIYDDTTNPAAGTRTLNIGNLVTAGTIEIEAGMNASIGSLTTQGAGYITLNGPTYTIAGDVNTGTEGVFYVYDNTQNLVIGGNFAGGGYIFGTPGKLNLTLNGTSAVFPNAHNLNLKSLTKTNGGSITFPTGADVIISDAVNLQGTAGHLMRLRSSSSGTAWNFFPPSSRTLTYLDVKDSNSSLLIEARGLGNIDSGGNTNWSLETYPTSITAPSAGTYVTNNSLAFTVNFNKSITVTGGTPTFPVTIGSNIRNASYFSGSGSTSLIFKYTIVSTDYDTDGISLGSSLSLNGSSMKDPGNDATLLTLPAVTTSGILVQGNTTLTVNKLGYGSGTVNIVPDQTNYLPTDIVTITATAGTGSGFSGWSGSVTSSTNPLNLTMSTDKTLTAYFDAVGSLMVDLSWDSSTPGWGVTRFAAIWEAIEYAANHPAVTKIQVAAGTYTENVNLNTGVTLVPADGVRIEGSLTQSAGTITAPDGNLEITGDTTLTGGTFTGSDTGTLILGGNLTRTDPAVFNSGGKVIFNGADAGQIAGVTSFKDLEIAGGGSLSSTAALTISGKLTVSDGTFKPADGSIFHDIQIETGATLDGSDGEISVSGDFINNGTFIPGTGKVTFNGNTDQVIGGSSETTFYDMLVNKTGGVLTGNTLVHVTHVLDILDGAFEPCTGSEFSNVNIGVNGELVMNAPAIISIVDMDNAGTFSPNGGTATISGNLTNSGTINPSGGIIDVTGNFINETGGDFSPSGGTANIGGFLTNSGTISPSGGIIDVTGNFINETGGEFTPSGGTANIGGNLTNSGTLSPSGGLLNIDGNLSNTGTINPSDGIIDVNGDFINETDGDFSPSGGTLNLAGDLTNDGSFIPTGGSVNFNGSGTQEINGSEPVIFSSLVISNPNGLGGVDPINGSDLTIASGITYTPPTGSQFHNVNIDAGGTLLMPTGGDIFVSGDWVNNGTFNSAGDSTVNFNGTADQTIGGSSQNDFDNLVINNSGGTVSTLSAITANELTITDGIFDPADGSSFGNVNIAQNGEMLVETGETIDVTGNLINAGSLSQTGGTLNVGGIFTNQVGGIYSPSAGDLNLTGDLINNGIFDASGGTANIGGNLTNGGTLSPSGGLLNIAGNLSNTGTINPSDGIIDVNGNFTNETGGDFSPSGGTFNLAGDLTNNGSFIPTGGVFNFNGSGSQEINGSEPVMFNSLVISNPNGVGGLDTISGNDLTIASGVTYTPPAGSHFHNVNIDAGGTLLMPTGGDIFVSGDWVNNGVFSSAGDSTVTFNGTADQAIGGTSQNDFDNLVINNSGGTVSTLSAITANELTITDGIFNPTDGSSFGNVNIAQNGEMLVEAGETIDVTGNLSNAGTLSQTGGTLNVGGDFTNLAGGIYSPSAGDLNLAGDLINNGTFDASGGSVTFNGTSDQNISGTQEPAFNNLIIDNPGHEVSSEIGINAVLLTISNGTFDPGDGSTFGDVLIESGGTLILVDGETVNVTNDLTNQGHLTPTGGILNIGGDLINTGTIDPSGGIIDVNGSFINQTGGVFAPSDGTLNIGGDLTNDGSFAPTGGTVVFDGSGPQTIDGTSTPIVFINLEIDCVGPVISEVPIVVTNDTNIIQGELSIPAGSVINNLNIEPGGSLVTPDGNVTFNAPILARPIPDQHILQDSLFEFIFAADTFSLKSGKMTYLATLADNSPLPAWLKFDPISRKFKGIPKAADLGLLEIKVIASSGGGKADDTYNLIVQGSEILPPVLVNPISDLNLQEGLLFSYTFPADTFFNPQASDLTYLVDGLPAWLTFTATTRTISGTPIASAGSINNGLLTISLTAINENGGSAVDTFNFQVYKSGERVPPSIKSGLQDQNSVVGTAFKYILPAEFVVNVDGTSTGFTYTAKLSSGADLPAWLIVNRVNGTLSGLPNANSVGSILIWVTATDANNLVIQDKFRLNIASADRLTNYIAVTSAGMTYIDGFGQYFTPSGDVPADGHYYMMIKLNVPVPVALTGYTSLNLGRQITLYDGEGNPVTAALVNPQKICFIPSAEQWRKYKGFPFSVGDASDLAGEWFRYEVTYPAANVICAETTHFSLYDLFVLLPLVDPSVDSKHGINTGFAPGIATVLKAQPVGLQYNDLGPLWLEIPSIGVKQSIVGVPTAQGLYDVSWLKDQVGWLQGTAYPGWDGNSLLTAHVYNSDGEPGPFHWLVNLKYNDRVILHAHGQKYIYQVQTTQAEMNVSEIEKAFKHEELSWLTLITCRGYDEKSNSYRWRTVVRAILMSTVMEP